MLLAQPKASLRAAAAAPAAAGTLGRLPRVTPGLHTITAPEKQRLRPAAAAWPQRQQQLLARTPAHRSCSSSSSSGHCSSSSSSSRSSSHFSSSSSSSRLGGRGAAWIARAASLPSPATPEPIPEDVALELDTQPGAKEVTYDEATKTVRIPLAAMGEGQRRTKMVMFTCNKCGGRSARLVNPLAWERGAVFCQCQHCGAWHMLAADKSIVEEVRYNDPDWQLPRAQQAAVQAAEAASTDGVVELVPSGDDDASSQASDATAAALGGADGGDDPDSAQSRG